MSRRQISITEIHRSIEFSKSVEDVEAQRLGASAGSDRSQAYVTPSNESFNQNRLSIPGAETLASKPGLNASQHVGFDAGQNPAKVIERASQFLLQDDAPPADDQQDTGVKADDTLMVLAHPMMDPGSGTCSYIQWALKRGLEHIALRLIIAAMIIADITLIVIDLITRDMDQHFYFIQCSFVFSWCFVLELCLRAFAFGLCFFRFWYNILDILIIVASTVGTTYILVDRVQEGEYFLLQDRRSPGFWHFIFALRFCRLAHFLRLHYEAENIKRAARQLVSQNKRRYNIDGFDLDLTYVTDRVIAMSFPSSGHMTLYRNPITEVARFFETKHGGHYKIFNLCKERGYDTRIFDDQVERFYVEDHNPPTCKDMLKFAKLSSEWLDQDDKNVIAVHCKGGKGRTGTMVCVYLVDNGLFSTAEDSLDYFGSRRTDTTQGNNFQGVETPSQCRYVGYYEAIRNHKHKLPNEVEMTLRSIRIWGMSTVGKGDGSDLTLLIESAEEGKIYENHFGKGSLRLYDKDVDELFVTFQSVPTFRGDIRFKFKCSSRKVPKGYEKTAWFFWFHTGFINHNRLKLERSDLDNPHKNKTWDVFRENFSVECSFQKVKKEKAAPQTRHGNFSKRLSRMFTIKVNPAKITKRKDRGGKW
ncbi:phosphatidylinositol 3,4,5-trisphosphate 3-phosphatase TPTE2-like [Amphibalanus amphitrite]|uniref:phosphatidylinositol 3,4,5-trisphosphate 3-phosphatase TPTE2-like n=1 Tax=Amphibalanus amphitrite TaxID=1232801 RepID=UPI001C91015D|nr:phosphatidylinositol 3,4,5-trisphosphate 3-phosphatase TPTE2-like [Amphibalanus amphitrite]